MSRKLLPGGDLVAVGHVAGPARRQVEALPGGRRCTRRRSAGSRSRVSGVETPFASRVGVQRVEQALGGGLRRRVAGLGGVPRSASGRTRAATPTSWPLLVTVTCRPVLAAGLVGFQVAGAPVQVMSDGIWNVAAGADGGVGDRPRHPLVEQRLGLGVAGRVVQLGDPLHRPHLHAEPLVRRRVVVDRVLRRRTCRRRSACRPAAGRTSRPSCWSRRRRCRPRRTAARCRTPAAGRGCWSSRRRAVGDCGLQLGDVGQRPGRERVLVAEVVVAGADPPRPAGAGSVAPPQA